MVRTARLAVAVLLVAAGYALASSTIPPIPVIVQDTVQVKVYLEQIERLTLDRDGWRARFEGIQERPPVRIIVTDTLIPPPDTVIRFVSVRNGTLSAEFLTQQLTISGDTMFAPELRTGFDIRDCDEGYTIGADGVTCDRAQFGHLYIGAIGSREPALAAWWRPSYRSPWELGVAYRGWWDVSVRWGFQIF